eukprot:TRINITY_DN2436_c0_g1_i2.p1 TRINITY_DN2436_c0_g1~~TRINITY_DN2436_c0_g1_i2.p1  ORF type:complete len:206 (-),score=51.29 TRINITY_DN2436_c0_g1_i2:85-702(-)
MKTKNESRKRRLQNVDSRRKSLERIGEEESKKKAALLMSARRQRKSTSKVERRTSSVRLNEVIREALIARPFMPQVAEVEDEEVPSSQGEDKEDIVLNNITPLDPLVKKILRVKLIETSQRETRSRMPTHIEKKPSESEPHWLDGFEMEELPKGIRVEVDHAAKPSREFSGPLKRDSRNIAHSTTGEPSPVKPLINLEKIVTDES